MVKRLFDMAFVVLMAWLWLPILALTALVVALVDGRPIFFLQQRAGRGGDGRGGVGATFFFFFSVSLLQSLFENDILKK